MIVDITEAKPDLKVRLLRNACSLPAGTVATIGHNRTGENNGACTWRDWVWVNFGIPGIGDGWMQAADLELMPVGDSQ